MARAPGKRKVNASTPAPHPRVFYSLHGLLHTVRVIGAHEDELCTLLHELRTAGTLSPAVATELSELLEAMPSWEYQDDLEAVRAALAGDPATSAKHRKPQTAGSRRRAKPASGRAQGPVSKRASKAPVRQVLKKARKAAVKRATKKSARRTRQP